MFRTIAASLAVAAVTAASAAQAEIPNPLTFGIISTESSQGLKQSFGDFLADMEKALGVKVNAFFAPDYAGVIEAMRFKKVDLAWFGNKSAMEAVDHATVLVLQTGPESAKSGPANLQPIALDLFYIADPDNPDVFRLAPGQF